MPFMSADEFEKRTSVTFAKRGEKLKAIATKLRAYNQTPTVDNLDLLREALEKWQWAHSSVAEPNKWQTNRRNVVKKQDHPIEELEAAVKQQYREEVRRAVGLAASTLDQVYGSNMDAGYRQQLTNVFVNTSASSTQALRCFVWFRSGPKLGDTMWGVRLQEAGWTPAQGLTDGLTEPQSAHNVDAWNTWLDTNKSTRGCAVVGRYVTADTSAPLDRVIETNTLKLHTVAHEMLHWLTHERFRDYSTTKITNAALGTLIREGLTEWLTRSALNEWDQGGYRDLIQVWQEMMATNKLKMSDLTEAYFRGNNVKEVCDEMAALAWKSTGFKAAMTSFLQQSAL